jgi:hypothetical protein
MWPFFVLVFCLGFMFFAVGVHREGFTSIPNTLYGICKDGSGHVFLGKIGGEGTFCPACRTKLELQHHGGFRPILSCKRNSRHAWQFDFTRVVD